MTWDLETYCGYPRCPVPAPRLGERMWFLDDRRFFSPCFGSCILSWPAASCSGCTVAPGCQGNRHLKMKPGNLFKENCSSIHSLVTEIHSFPCSCVLLLTTKYWFWSWLSCILRLVSFVRLLVLTFSWLRLWFIFWSPGDKPKLCSWPHQCYICTTAANPWLFWEPRHLQQSPYLLVGG